MNTFAAPITPAVLPGYEAPKPVKIGPVTYHYDIEQGSDEWRAVRCGVLTASELKKIMTPTLKVAANEKERAHVYEIAAQRISQYVEPTFISDDMLRGQVDEVDARILYAEKFAEVQDCGFITNDRHGVRLGYSPDGLVGVNGLIECKSRLQRFQVQTMVEHVATGGLSIPVDYLLQHQGGLLISERDWIDFISYSGGLPMAVIRVHPDDAVREAIINAALEFEARVAAVIQTYTAALDSGARLVPTERKDDEGDIL